MATAKKIEMYPDEKYLQEAMAAGRCTIQELSMKALGTPDVAYQARDLPFDLAHVRLLEGKARDNDGRLDAVVVFMATVGAIVRYILADGFHRHTALRNMGARSIRAYVVACAPEDVEHQARLFAAMCNRRMCLPRKKEDIRKAVEMLFADPECWNWSSTKIADHCGLNPTSVVTYRNEYSTRKQIPVPEKLTAQDGRECASKTRATTGKPAISRDRNGRFRATYRGRKYTGSTQEELEAKLAEASAEVARSRRLLDNQSFRRWLSNRNVITEDIQLPLGPAISLTGSKNATALLVTCQSDGAAPVFSAVGRLRLLRQHAGMLDARLIVACYPEDHPAAILDLARRDGIECLTPDEVVATFREVQP